MYEYYWVVSFLSNIMINASWKYSRMPSASGLPTQESYSCKAAWQCPSSICQRNDKSHSTIPSCPHRLKTAIPAPSRAVTTGNLSTVRTKKLSGHSRNARWTVFWGPDEYLRQTGALNLFCHSLSCLSSVSGWIFAPDAISKMIKPSVSFQNTGESEDCSNGSEQ